MGTAVGPRGYGEQGHAQAKSQNKYSLDCARLQAHRSVRSAGIQ